MKPPRLATWLLDQLGPSEALAGDLIEEYARRGSAFWFWRQVIMAVLANRSTLRQLGVLAPGLVALFWLGRYIPVPGVNGSMPQVLFEPASGGLSTQLLVVYNIVTGGNLGHLSVLALGILPYISALCVLYIVGAVYSGFGWSTRNGRLNPSVFAGYARYVAFVLCVVQAIGIARFLEVNALVAAPGIGFTLRLALILSIATGGLVWLAEEITRRSVGMGTSLVFFTAMLVGLPSSIAALVTQSQSGRLGPAELLWFVLGLSVLSALVLLVDPGRRRTNQPALP
jgi:preprotein translocase subunit SecY